jgi:hypothetical protein
MRSLDQQKASTWGPSTNIKQQKNYLSEKFNFKFEILKKTLRRKKTEFNFPTENLIIPLCRRKKVNSLDPPFHSLKCDACFMEINARLFIILVMN